MNFLSKRKRKKNMVQEYRIDDIPALLKMSRIKPTKCEVCQSVYQAEWKHIKYDRNIAYIARQLIYTICPVCKSINKVEFEEATIDENKKN